MLMRPPDFSRTVSANFCAPAPHGEVWVVRTDILYSALYAAAAGLARATTSAATSTNPTPTPAIRFIVSPSSDSFGCDQHSLRTAATTSPTFGMTNSSIGGL